MAVAASAQQQQVQQAAAGQADYSKQWAEYYRSIGKIDEAEAIEKQITNIKVIFFFIVQSPTNGQFWSYTIIYEND